MDYWKRRSHARGVYPTQDTSRTKTPTVKQEQQADIRILVKVWYEMTLSSSENVSPKVQEYIIIIVIIILGV